MIPALAPSGLGPLRSLVADRFGLSLDASKLDLLSERLCQRIEAMGCAAGGYLENLAIQDRAREEWRFLAEELTVPETYFFRHLEQLHAFAERVLPERLRARGPEGKLRLLSAGCASGEEPYSLAMLIQQHAPGLRSRDLEIRAVDINPAVLRRAIRARYSPWSLRETPDETKRRWFREDGREFRLDGRIRDMVAFEEGNLIQGESGLWPSGSYDVIFCRNVIMYFTPEHARAVVSHAARALAPGGYLFLGHAETLRGLSNDFHLYHSHDAFYYRRKDHLAPADPEVDSGVLTGAETAPPLASIVDSSDSWIESIQRASERIKTMADHGRAPVHARVLERRESATQTLGRAMGSFELERYQEALGILQELPAHASGSPDVLLLRAALLTQSQNRTGAEEACRALLGLDELNAGAHYLLALCREASGDSQGALGEDRIAAYLDPGFALPRLHLGLMARRAGDRAGACLELGQALALLHREDASRVLLFGGGFNRETLLALCRAELLACGGHP